MANLKHNCVILALLAFLFLLPAVSGANLSQKAGPENSPAASVVNVYFFYGQGCPHCAKEEPFLHALEKKYPQLKVHYYEVWHNRSNKRLFEELSKKYNIKIKGVPTTFIGQFQPFVGYGTDDTTGKEIESAVEYCIKNSCKDALKPEKKVPVVLFVSPECAQCTDVIGYISRISKAYSIELTEYNISTPEGKSAYDSFKQTYNILPMGFPVLFIGDRYFIGRDAIMKSLVPEIKKCEELGCVCRQGRQLHNMPKPHDFTPEKSPLVSLPLLGSINTESMPLVLFTVLIAFLDSFNPCAFFVLLFLLTMMIYAKSRKRMLLIGFTYVFFSGLIYFLFMAAWLNLFLIIGQLKIITAVAGTIALFIAIINIKDFFAFKKGISLTIPEDKKPKLFKRMRLLLKAESLYSMLIGTSVLAIAANSYELLCTAGFPMVFTRILTLHNVSMLSYYSFLLLYNLIYIIPLAAIVVIFTITLGAKKLTSGQGRLLKLISGTMMLFLGSVLLFRPGLLNNVVSSIIMLAASLLLAFSIYFVHKRLIRQKPARRKAGD